MSDWYFIIAAFAVLLACEKLGKPKFLPTSHGVGAVFSETIEIWGQIALMLILPQVLTVFGVPVSLITEIGPVYVLTGAYFFRRPRKISTFSFMTVFTVTLFCLLQMPGFSAYDQLFKATLAVLSIGLLELLILGVQERMILSDIPKSLNGLPVFLLSCSLLTLAFWGLQFLLP